MTPSQEWLELTHATSLAGERIVVHLPLIAVMLPATTEDQLSWPGAKTVIGFDTLKVAVHEPIDDILNEIDLRR